ncbi:hypothetical protein GT360_13570 [Vibrio astriarenae]|uniref:Sulfotransferase domain-containing protein n=1 Tax=Vibrio astriarenae TaxID=1481923 RepID=A0A7Z2YEL0_9VIBR|nr:hypothetical protein [Vibrio astriarenae]QIA64456.1 hypothetical protein GT360_13570 [Vibrio astriarenae]
MPTLYIHIGHEKTGTTAIQRFCANNREKLEEYGVLYPSIGYQDFVHSSLVNCIHDLDNNTFLEFFPEGVDTEPENVWGELVKNAASWDKDILISSEHFISRLREKGVEYIKAYLKANLPKYQVKIIAFLRRQDECYVSRLSTLSKAGAVQGVNFWESEVLNKNIYYDYYTLMKLWANAFGSNSIILREYDRESDVTKDIQSIIFKSGYDLIDVKSNRENTSWSPVATHIGFKVNSICKRMSVVERRNKINKINNLLYEHGEYKHTFNGYSLIDFVLAKRINEIYHDSNRMLESEFYNGNRIFRELNDSEYTKTVSHLSDSDIIRALFKIV